MPRLIYTPDALRDIARLEAFLRKKDPDATKRAVRAIRESLGRLAARLDIGRPANHMPAGFKEWSIRFGQSGYVALYRSDKTATVVLAVRHFKETGY